MSENNIGSQSQTFDFRLPIKAAKFNRILRSIHKPGVYKGMTLSFTGSTVFVDAGSIFINCFFGGDDNLAMKIDFDSIIIQEDVLQSSFGENEVAYISYEFGEIIDNYAELKFTPLSNWLLAPDPNGIVLGEIEFNSSPPYNITGVNYTRKTWGLTNADAEDTFNDEVIYSDTDNTNKKWKVKGGNLSTGTTILDFQSLTETAARIPLTNGTNTTIIENRLQVAKFDGRVPLGAVIPIVGTRTAVNNGGSANTPSGIPATGIVSDDGFQRCDGSAVGSGATLTGFVPDLTDDRFIQGSTSLGSLSSSNGINLGDNTVQLTINELPSHNHTGSTGDNTSIDHTHSITHNHGVYRAVGGGGFSGFEASVSTSLQEPSPYMNSFVGNSGGMNSNLTHTHSLTTDNSGSGGTFDIRPKWMSAIYLMRVR